MVGRLHQNCHTHGSDQPILEKDSAVMQMLDKLWLMGDGGATALATIGTLQANIKMMQQALDAGPSLDNGELTEVIDLAVERLELTMETCTLTNQIVAELVGSPVTDIPSRGKNRG